MTRSKSMRVLLLAPHPFYQERGTPIAVDLLLGALSRRGCEVDVVTFHEGEARNYPGVVLHRIAPVPPVRGVRPGFSLKKLYCDLFLYARARRVVLTRRPRVVHAVEESVFLARRLARQFRLPYIYDMDSSLARQMVEKMPWLKPLRPFFRWMETRAIRDALAVAPVCPALADLARQCGARQVHLLSDISLMPETAAEAAPPAVGPFRFMYIGNLESYQGIDLLLESFARALKIRESLELVVVGGAPGPVEHYRRRSAQLGLGQSVTFLGPHPISELPALCRQAGALVSPRIRGDNTPMKIYTYLDSGRPVLATDLPTHTQVLTPEVALLAEPNPDAMAAAMVRLARDADLRERLATQARALVRSKYNRRAFETAINELYDFVESAL